MKVVDDSIGSIVPHWKLDGVSQAEHCQLRPRRGGVPGVRQCLGQGSSSRVTASGYQVLVDSAPEARSAAPCLAVDQILKTSTESVNVTILPRSHEEKRVWIANLKRDISEESGFGDVRIQATGSADGLAYQDQSQAS